MSGGSSSILSFWERVPPPKGWLLDVSVGILGRDCTCMFLPPPATTKPRLKPLAFCTTRSSDINSVILLRGDLVSGSALLTFFLPFHLENALTTRFSFVAPSLSADFHGYARLSSSVVLRSFVFVGGLLTSHDMTLGIDVGIRKRASQHTGMGKRSNSRGRFACRTAGGGESRLSLLFPLSCSWKYSPATEEMCSFQALYLRWRK